MIIPWLVTKMKSMMHMVIMTIMVIMIFPWIIKWMKTMMNMVIMIHHSKVYNKDEDHP